MRLTREEFEGLVEQALAELPRTFVPYMQDLTVDIEDMPDTATCKSLGIDDPRDLLGFYHGTPITERSVEHTFRWPERIIIYHANIQRCCRTRRQIVRQIRKTVLHEIGHHFGLDEDELDELGYA